MSKQQKIIYTFLLCASLYTVKLFAPPADEQDLSTKPVTQTVVRQFMETVSTANQLIGQHTPTYFTNKITPKNATLTASTLAARALYVCYFQNAPKPAIPTSPALRFHQEQKSQTSFPLTKTPHAQAFQPTYTPNFLQNMPSQSLTQAVIEGLKTDVQPLEKQKTSRLSGALGFRLARTIEAAELPTCDARRCHLKRAPLLETKIQDHRCALASL